jgi:hypothetical protein
MRRLTALRVTALVFTLFVAVAPAFSMPRREPSSGVLDRIVWKIRSIFHPIAAEEPTFPKP